MRTSRISRGLKRTDLPLLKWHISRGLEAVEQLAPNRRLGLYAVGLKRPSTIVMRAGSRTQAMARNTPSPSDAPVNNGHAMSPRAGRLRPLVRGVQRRVNRGVTLIVTAREAFEGARSPEPIGRALHL
jgi:hypothetical protein